MNIYDIAKEAGVSTATVSRVINNKPNISPKTRKRVTAVLERHNYIPSSIARGLINNSMNLTGVVMRDIRLSHYNSFAFNIEQELNRNGYSCIIANASDCDLTATFRVFAQVKVDGIILIGSDLMNGLTRSAILSYHPKTPIVFLNGSIDLPNVTSIIVDDRAGILQCMEHLFARGRRRPVYVNDNTTDSAKRKCEGFVDALGKWGIENPEGRIIQSTLGFQGGIECGRAILKQYKEDVDCVICAEDVTALGCMRAFEMAGKAIPRDIAITGYSNSAECKMANRVLTSVDTKLEMMGLEAATALYNKMNGKAWASRMMISPELVIGESS